MDDRERGTHLIHIGMAGSLAMAVVRIAMRDNRPVSQEEVEFIDKMPDQTTRDISNFCFDRGIEPTVVIGIHSN